MAHKYDLLLVNTEQEGNKKHRPWYKERLKTKYINPKSSKQCSGTLVGSSWTFIKKGLDDFRDGMPPDVSNDEMVLRGYKGVMPNCVSSSNNNKTPKPTEAKKRFTKEEVVFSRTLPMQQQRRDNVDDIETSLLQHQLALFPHLQDSVPPEVFEDVIDVLDPELQLGSEEDPEDHQIPCDDLNESQTRESTYQRQSVSPTDTDRKSVTDQNKSRYIWLPKVEETQREDKVKSSRKKMDTPSLDARIQDVTKEFCSWVEDLGGESNNIEESTIMSLFASGYETKPTLSVPVHVVELTNVPPELRINASPSDLTRQQNVNIDANQPEKQDTTMYTPSWVKIKYGAWYLNPRTWKKQEAGESLQDPKEQQNNILSEAKVKSQKLDNELATLHGARAFKCFMEKKGTRKPEFLSVVEKAQEEDARAVGEKDPRLTPAASNTLPVFAMNSPSVSPSHQSTNDGMARTQR